MRGVVVVILVIFTAMLVLFVSTAAVEPIGEHFKTYDSIDEGPLEGTSVINSVYDVLFKWVPMIFVFGMITWGVAWALRSEAFVGRGGGGGGLGP